MSDLLKHIHQFCDGQAELRALPSGKQHFVDFGDSVAIDEFCLQHKNENMFFGVATRDGGGGTKNNIVNFPAVWCDIDFKDTPKEIARDKLKQFPFKPSAIVKSGGGIHLYWLLSESAEKGEIKPIEDVNDRIAIALGGDMNATDAARIMRLPGTLNHKYDPPRPCELIRVENFTYTLDDFLEILPPIQNDAVKDETKSSNDSNWLEEAMQGCSQGGRNAMATKLAGYWVNKVSVDDVKQILSSWNKLNTPPLSDAELQTTVRSVSRYEPEKGQNRVDISNVYTPDRMIEAYLEHVKSLKQNRFITGINEIDRRIRGVSGGEVLTIIARSGSFKTALLQNLLRNYIKNSSWAALFLSIEMPVPGVTERYLQIIFEEQGSAVENMFSGGEHPETFNEVCDDFKQEMKRFFMVPVKVSLSDIPAYVRLIETEYNVKVGVVGIDYLGLLDGPGHNEYETVSRLATGMKHTAKMMNLPLVVLSQTSRQGGSGNSEITLNMGRGSGAIEEGADFVLGLWQRQESDGVTATRELICKILKNRKGPAGSAWNLDLDPKTFRIGSDAWEYKPPNKKNGGF